MKKKIVAISLIAAMAFTLTACSSGKGKTEQEAKTDESGIQSDYKIEDCVTLGDYSGLEISLPGDYEVTTKQVNEYALSNAKQSAKPSYKDTDKKTVEEGDTVNIDYEGTKDGVAFAGGTAQGQYLTIGSHDFIDGFEDGLIGKKVGKTVKLDLTFPENYGNKDLAGADVVFTVKINKIVKEDNSVKFKLTDEFAKENLSCDSVKEYKKQIREYLETQNDSQKQSDTRQAVINKLKEICTVKEPEGILDERVSDYEKRFEKQNCKDTTLEAYLSDNYDGKTVDEFRSEVSAELKDTLQTELILEAIVKKEGLKLDEDAFKDYVKQQVSSYGYENDEAFYNAYHSDAKEGEKYVRKVYVCNQALDKVVEDAKVETSSSEKS